MKKVVLKLDLHGEREKQKAMRAVSGLLGIDSISMDMKDKKMTVVGDVDPICIARKLRKQWYTEIVTVGPAKEEMAELIRAYNAHNHQMASYYRVVSLEENPNWCVMC